LIPYGGQSAWPQRANPPWYPAAAARDQRSETKQSETKQSETKQSETKQSGTKRSETKQSGTKRAETKRSETSDPGHAGAPGDVGHCRLAHGLNLARCLPVPSGR
jgi:hypothetical protein